MSSIKIRSKRLGDKTQIRTLIAHPMENGRSPDKNGQFIPAHFIREISVKQNDRVVLNGHLGGSISKDPYFAFMLKNARPGDKITISWSDNQGLSDSKDHFIR
nr:thiosulfate oxidation carrier complex protein SoxZ [Methylomarinum sp. Ch1-1]MDP4521063.1 thiosulfate oxidation carrier complex protein SoxZ [Methylomarinum sp. Ch1-1]